MPRFSPKMNMGEPEVERELKQEQGGCGQACMRGVMEQLMNKACSGKKSLFSVSCSDRTKSLPRTWPGLKRGWGFAAFTASCWCPHHKILQRLQIRQRGPGCWWLSSAAFQLQLRNPSIHGVVGAQQGHQERPCGTGPVSSLLCSEHLLPTTVRNRSQGWTSPCSDFTEQLFCPSVSPRSTDVLCWFLNKIK